MITLVSSKSLPGMLYQVSAKSGSKFRFRAKSSKNSRRFLPLSLVQYPVRLVINASVFST